MKWILSLVLGVFMAVPAFAQMSQQQREKNRQEIEAVRVAFITREARITPEEAEKFWPVYNAYQKELHVILHDRKKQFKQAKENPEVKFNVIEFDTRMLNLKKKYQAEFARVLSADKAAAVFVAEREFREQLIKQLNDRKKAMN